MSRSRFFSISTALCTLVVAFAISSAILAAAPSGDADAVSPSLDGVTSPSTFLGRYGKGLDRGILELFQTTPDPSAWVWVEDSTHDGVGTEYWVVHPSYEVPGASDPSVDVRFEYVAQHPTINTFNDFLAFVIATYPNVTGPGDVQVYRKDAGPIGP